jgi:hypothetical protein
LLLLAEKEKKRRKCFFPCATLDDDICPARTIHLSASYPHTHTHTQRTSQLSPGNNM